MGRGEDEGVRLMGPRVVTWTRCNVSGEVERANWRVGLDCDGGGTNQFGWLRSNPLVQG